MKSIFCFDAANIAPFPYTSKFLPHFLLFRVLLWAKVMPQGWGAEGHGGYKLIDVVNIVEYNPRSFGAGICPFGSAYFMSCPPTLYVRPSRSMRMLPPGRSCLHGACVMILNCARLSGVSV